MNAILDTLAGPTEVAPLVLMPDVDEIPTAAALGLIQHCTASLPLHLQLSQYLYSFEWFVGRQSWRAAVTLWDRGDGMRYGHGKKGDAILASSGMHCR